MVRVSFNEENQYRRLRSSGGTKRGGIREFLVNLGVPPTSVNLVLLVSVGAALLFAAFLFMRAGSSVDSPRPPLEELQSMNAQVRR